MQGWRLVGAGYEPIPLWEAGGQIGGALVLKSGW